MKLLIFVLAISALQHQMVASFPTATSFPKPPHPENRTKSRSLEIFFQNTTRGADCSIMDSHIPSQKNGLISQRARWEEFPIYIDSQYDDNERELINNAADRLSKVIPCVKFGLWGKNESPAGYNGAYIHIKKTHGGCWSYVGKVREIGAQEMSLDDGCMHTGIIMHEMIHALGFFHEQSRSDRDDYVTIKWENILPGFKSNFDKYSSSKVTAFGVQYNTKSIMHYSSYAFSKNGKPTIVTKAGNTIPYARELQETDISKLKKMYKC